MSLQWNGGENQWKTGVLRWTEVQGKNNNDITSKEDGKKNISFQRLEVTGLKRYKEQTFPHTGLHKEKGAQKIFNP